MVRQLEKIYYPSAIIMIAIVVYIATYDMIYLLLFIPVLLLLGLIKVYTKHQRLLYAGKTALGKVVQFRACTPYDENLATSRRGRVKKEVFIVEFTTQEGKVIRGQPMQFLLDDEINEADALEGNSYIGKEVEITYDIDRPTTFTVSEFVKDDLSTMLKIIYTLSVIVVLLLAVVLSKIL